MERRINARIDAHLVKFKNDILAQFEAVRQKCANCEEPNAIHKNYAEIMSYIYSADKLKLSKEDFVKRKRIKNVVTMHSSQKGRVRLLRNARKGYPSRHV